MDIDLVIRLRLLRKAIEEDDPKREILMRVSDLIADLDVKIERKNCAALIHHTSEGLMDEIEAKAIRMFEERTFSVTGHVWKWEEAGEEIREEWRAHARRGCAPELPPEWR